MSRERMIQAALQLMKLGVSKSGVENLLNFHELDDIEKQLEYLPFRKAKRPEAFIVQAIRKRYSAPKDYFHAKAQTDASGLDHSLDETS